ncbi:hypothetical protein RCC89_16080 [Cytophagaceae bacterium ABcell3]|nr:hypothetical protein RCC89_16080 [Cytophagaceae bacterium ABcell3]
MQLSVSKNVHIVEPGDFEPTDHWYPRVLNSNIHPLVSYFLNLSTEQIIERYNRLHPQSDSELLKDILSYKPSYLKWAGTDLMYVVNKLGQRRIALIETNSCPSGQKSMPLLDLNVEQGGYKRLIEGTFKPMVDSWPESGALAVVYDKNGMENIGYAATIAEVFNEHVYLVNCSDFNESVKFEDGVMYVWVNASGWVKIRAAFRYVTQKPWELIPEKCGTLLLNPLEACLAGGRNKEMAEKAYLKFNEVNDPLGLQILTPATFLNVEYSQLQEYYQMLDKAMVIKVPTSNAGQGVMTVTNDNEFLDALNRLKSFQDNNLIVQQLVKAAPAHAAKNEKTWHHVGTVPDLKGRSYAFDIRMMVHYTERGMKPLAIYSRRARAPLNMGTTNNSWDVYGTNLSIRHEDGWSYEDERLMLYDVRDFGYIGLGLYELISGFVQSCMAVYAIDRQAVEMFSEKSRVYNGK